VPDEKKRVLLLVPPGPVIYIRDNYCSFSSKADYYWPPIDLVAQSGLLRGRAPVSVLDATAERMSDGGALDAAAALRPDATIFVTGTASLEADMRFVERLKERTGTRLYGSGGNLAFWGEDIMRAHPALDGVLLEFISGSLAALISGDPQEKEGVILREGGEPHRYPSLRKKGFRVGIPMHEAFPLERYRVPQARRHPFVRTLTSFGCSYRCDFCIESAFPLVYRDMDEIRQELRALSETGIREIYFMDNVLTAGRERFLLLCEELERLGGFSWFGQSRVDNLDDEIAAAAKRAGCHMLMIGVESGSDALLAAHRKGHGTRETRDAFACLRKHGIESLAYFMLGLPGETPESMQATLDLALQIPCDYVSFTIATPDPGTPMREAAIRSGELDAGQTEFDCSCGSPLRLPAVTPRQLRAFQRKAHRAFYLRPQYLVDQLRRVRGPGDLYSKCRAGFRLLFGGS